MTAEPIPVSDPFAPTLTPAPDTAAHAVLAAERRAARVLGLGAGLGTLALLLALLPRVPGIGDSAEFTLALALAGVPHPTGYPLYVLAGHAFVAALHAMRVSWTTAANAWSAVGGAVAAGLYAALAHRLATRLGGVPASAARLVALLSVGLLVLHPMWLRTTTVAEIHAWQFAWLAGAALFVLDHAVALEAPGARARAGRTALGWGVLCGLGAAHHATSVFFIAPFTVALVVSARRTGCWRPSLAAIAAAGLAIPLLGCAWIDFRAHHPVTGQWPLEATAAAVWRHVTGAAYRGYLGRFAPSPGERALLARAVFPFLVPGAIGGAWFALRMRDRALRAWLLAFLLGAALLVAFVANYGVPDPASYFVAPLMAALLLAVPLGLALAARASRPIAIAVLAAAPLALAAWSIPDAVLQRRQLVRVDRRIHAAWRAIPFERGVVLWADDHYRRLVLFQTLEHESPGRVVEDPTLLTWPRERARFARAAGFDPLAGFTVRSAADVARIADQVRRVSPLPVVDFRDVLEARGAGPRP